MFPLPGSPVQSDHFVLPATEAAAPTASHSFGESTATRLPLTNTCAVGQAFLSSLPTSTSVEPYVFGRTIRACSIPGSRTFATYVAVPATIGGIDAIGCDVPITVYWLVGFVGGVPQIPANRLLVKHRAALGSSLRYFRWHAPDKLRRSVEALMDWYRAGKIRPLVSHRLPLGRSVEAIKLLTDRKAHGKIVVVPQES